jgi:hypothetical protein
LESTDSVELIEDMLKESFLSPDPLRPI